MAGLDIDLSFDDLKRLFKGESVEVIIDFGDNRQFSISLHPDEALLTK